MITPIMGDAAARLRANGYAPIGIPPGQPAPVGPWAVWQLTYVPERANDAVALLCRLPPARGPGGVDNHADTWVAALVVAVPHAEARAAIEAVIAQHVKPGPVRVTADGQLYLLRLDGPSFKTITREYPNIGRVDLQATGGFVSVSGEWQNGDPLTVPRRDLPMIDVEAANTLMAAIDGAAGEFIPLPAGAMFPTPSHDHKADGLAQLQMLLDNVGPHAVDIVAHQLGVDVNTYLTCDAPAPKAVVEFLEFLGQNIVRDPVPRGPVVQPCPLEQLLRERRAHFGVG